MSFPDSATFKRPISRERNNSTRSDSYEDDSSSNPSAASERSCSAGTSTGTGTGTGKRYPCRYHESHGCEKTFTTSGHASRHSKIHTAEKAVHCTYAGCQKKFTRADNMKQHLETHYKDKTRATAHRTHSSAKSDRSSSSSTRRSSASGRAHRASSATARSTRDDDSMNWEADQLPLPTPTGHTPLASPGAGSTWDIEGLQVPLMSRPLAARTPSGLDTLALAIASQEELTVLAT